MNSALFVGKVTHRRKSPMQHRLRYRTYSLLVDLDELTSATQSMRFLSHNRWNLFSIHDRDHGPRDGQALRPWIEAELKKAQIYLEGGSIQVLLYPRILGYTFNPLTMWFCHHSDGTLRAVLYEIRNTFGHSYSHLVPVAGTGPQRHRFNKELHVSPFFDQDGSYSFTLRPPAERFSVSIDYATDATDLLTATVVGERRHLNDRALLRVFASHPLLTLKVTLGIHWHALRLLLKGAKYRSVPKPPSTKVRLESTFEAAS